MIGVVVNSCHSLPAENNQVRDMNVGQSLHFECLSDGLKNELLISEKELVASLYKSEHSFLRNLLEHAEMNDKLYGCVQTDVGFDTTAADSSEQISDDINTVSPCTDVSDWSDVRLPAAKSESVLQPSAERESGNKRGSLRCLISRSHSTTDRTCADESTDSLLKTPAGFYDRSCTSSGFSIPPLFDYSSGLFTNPCNSGNTSYSFSNGDNSTLCSIMEDEKWSEGSDFDASSISALSQPDFTEDRMPSVPEDEDEDRLSKQEECVVLSVVQNVLSDEALTLNLDGATRKDNCSVEHQNLPAEPSSENAHAADSSQPLGSAAADLSKLNPLAKPFSCVPKVPLQPVPVVFTPRVPTVVIPVKFMPVSVNRPTSANRLEKNKGNRTGTPSKQPRTPNGNVKSSMYYAGGPMVPNFHNVGMYYYHPWQPVYYVGRSCFPTVSVNHVTPTTTSSARHHVKSRSRKEAVQQEKEGTSDSSRET